MDSGFVHLHLHSNYSLLTGASTLRALLERARSLGMRALALTDEDNLYGAISFYRMARGMDIKPIIGCDISESGGKRRAVILAKDREGYSNLCRIITERRLDEDFNLHKALLEYGGGLFIMSSDVSLLEGIARERGAKDLFVEFVSHGSPLTRMRELYRSARRAKLAMVAANDVYFADEKDYEVHKVLTAVRRNELLEKVHPGDFVHRDAFLKSAREMKKLFSPAPELLRNSLRLADECNLELELGRPVFPKVKLPDGETSYSYLYKLCFEGLKKRYFPISERAVRRLTYELDVISKLGFSDYFILVWDIVRFCRSKDIPVVGRGSAASSIVSYVLELTSVDPLAYDLYFERFLNMSRTDCPDIDLDLCWRRRDEVIDYVYKKHTAERVAMICTHDTLQARGAFREAAKALGIPADTVNKYSRRIPHFAAGSLHDVLAGSVEGRGLPLEERRFREILDMSDRIRDYPRHLGIHCGGIVISPGKLTDYLPLEEATKGIVVTQFEMHSVEDMGLVKIDLLGQRALTEIKETVDWVKKTRGVRIDVDKIPDNDEKTAELLRNGRTLGCFQIESPGMRNLLQMLKTDSVDKTIAAHSLIRPGPAGSGMKEAFIRRAAGIEAVTFLHPKLKELLGDTYGVMLYQEDVLKVARAVAGFTLEEGERLRRAISKERSRERMAAIKNYFISKSMESGIEPRTAGAIWKQVQKFSAYSFCKAHAATYGVLAYRSAYLKAHYPLEFMTALFNNHAGMYETRVHLEEARRLGLEILLPDVNFSEYEYSVEEGRIRMGLIQIKNLSQNTAEKIVGRRRERRFASLEDFISRVKADSRELENMILCGAMDSMPGTRPHKLWLLNKLIEAGGLTSDGTQRLLAPLVGEELPELPDYSDERKLQSELEILEAAVSRHPLELFRERIESDGHIKSTELKNNIGRRVKLLGILAAKRRTPTRGGRMMAFVTLEDEWGIFEVTLFPEVYRRFGAYFSSYGAYEVTGRVENQFGALTLTLEKARIIQPGK